MGRRRPTMAAPPWHVAVTRSSRTASAAAAAFLLAVLLLVLPHWAGAATDSERRALLDIKAVITEDPTGGGSDVDAVGGPLHLRQGRGASAAVRAGEAAGTGRARARPPRHARR